MSSLHYYPKYEIYAKVNYLVTVPLKATLVGYVAQWKILGDWCHSHWHIRSYSQLYEKCTNISESLATSSHPTPP